MKQDPVFEHKRTGDAPRLAADWSGYLAELGGGVTIAGQAWAATPSGLTFDQEGSSSGVTSARVSGGTDGVEYEVVNTVTLSNSQIESYVITLRVSD